MGRFLQRLLDASRAAIRRFAIEHPDTEVCYFAYDSEPRYGYVLICFNTSHSNLRYVRECHDRRVEYRKKLLSQPCWRDSAYHQVKTSSVLPFCDNTGDFAYPDFAEVKFPEWTTIAETGDYPKEFGDVVSYLENRVALTFARALDQLAEGGSLAVRKLSTPTLFGFGFHDKDQIVVRMLNVDE